MAFSPPANPDNNEEYKYGNVIWQYQNPPGVWNIKDGTVVGKNGVGVSGFFIGQGAPFVVGDLYFYYVYEDGSTSDEISLGNVVGDDGSNAAPTGLTFQGSDGSKDRVDSPETITITGANSNTIKTSIANNLMTIDVGLAGTSVTGIASFDSNNFDVSGVGKVSLKATYGVTGDTVTSSDNAIKVSRSGNEARVDARNATYSLTGVASFSNQYFSVVDGAVSITSGTFVHTVNGATGSILNGVGKDRVVFSSTTGLSGNSGFLFDGTSLTFGFDTRVVDGVFKTPREFSVHVDNSTSNELVINATGGSIQRFTITPQNDQFKIKTGTGWSDVNGHVETVVVLIKPTNGTTGTFDNSILAAPRPILFGVADAVDIISIMRIKTAAGGLTMGFVYAEALPGGANFT